MTTPDENTTPETEASDAGRSRPVVKFSGSGGLTAAVWKNRADNGIEHYSVRLERTYKAAETGEYVSTPYLREGDLLRAQRILGQVDDWIEQDRAKYRSGQHEERSGRQ